MGSGSHSSRCYEADAQQRVSIRRKVDEPSCARSGKVPSLAVPTILARYLTFRAVNGVTVRHRMF